MRLILLIGFLIPNIVVFSKGKEDRADYSILSDTLDSTVKPGKCVVEGTVHFRSLKLSGALVATCDSRLKSYSDSLGRFSIEVDVKDSCLYMFKAQYREIVTENIHFKSGHRMKIDFYAMEDHIMIEVDKPVIYLYSEGRVRGSLKVNPRSNFTFTYPEYKNGWQFSLANDSLYVDQKNYPYLFWEGETTELPFIERIDGLKPNAFVLKTDTAISFLEKQLDHFNLNPTEKTDFITFWAPRLQQHNYAVVQFLWGQDYSKNIAGIEINPTPDSMIRLFMLFQGNTNEPLEATAAPTYPAFERTGFTLVEWGGAEIPGTPKETP